MIITNHYIVLFITILTKYCSQTVFPNSPFYSKNNELILFKFSKDNPIILNLKYKLFIYIITEIALT